MVIQKLQILTDLEHCFHGDRAIVVITSKFRGNYLFDTEIEVFDCYSSLPISKIKKLVGYTIDSSTLDGYFPYVWVLIPLEESEGVLYAGSFVEE